MPGPVQQVSDDVADAPLGTRTCGAKEGCLQSWISLRRLFLPPCVLKAGALGPRSRRKRESRFAFLGREVRKKQRGHWASASSGPSLQRPLLAASQDSSVLLVGSKSFKFSKAVVGRFPDATATTVCVIAGP